MTSSLTGLSTMGIVNTESVNNDAGLFEMPMPGSAAEQKYLQDLFGASRTITIKGTFTDGYGGKTIAQFAAEFDALISGSQSSKTYVSDKTGISTSGLVSSAVRDDVEGAPGKIDYTITFYVGSV